jgi:hypothetical protein
LCCRSGFFAASVRAAQYGTAEEAKAMLERAVAAVKEDKAKALDMFNEGNGGQAPVNCLPGLCLSAH